MIFIFLKQLVFFSLTFPTVTAFLFTAFATAIASQLEDMQAFPLIMNFIAMPMFFLSGALFPLRGLPNAIEVIARLNPLSYGVDALRDTLSNASLFGLSHDFVILSLVTAVFLAVGSYLFSRIQI